MADRTVRVRLEAITGAFQAKMAEAGVATKALETRVAGFHGQMAKADLSAKGMLGSLGNLAGGELAAGAAAAVAGAAILKMTTDGIKHYVALADEVRKFERVSGASAEQSSLMIERAKVLGVNTDSLSTSFFRLSQNVETNRVELAKHGVEIVRNRDGNVDLVKTFDLLTEAYQHAGSAQERNRITQLALSRGAIQLLPLLKATREQLAEIDAGARAHHMVLSDQDLANALQYKIALHEMHDAWVGIEQELAKGVLPSLTKMVEDVTKIVDGLDRAANIKIPIPDVDSSGKRSFTSSIGGLIGDVIKGGATGGLDKPLERLFDKHNEGAKAAAAVEEAFKAQIEANTQAVKDYSDNLDNLYSTTFGVSDATDKFETDLAGVYTAFQKAKDSNDKYATSLATSSTTGLKNRAMLQGLETDLGNAAKKYKELHPDATDAEIRKALSGQIGQLKVLLGYFSGDKVEAQRLRDVLNDIAGIDLSKPGKTYHFGFGGHITNPFAGGGPSTEPPPAPPIDTTTPPDKIDPSGYLQSLFDQRMEQIKNRFHAGQATLAEYNRSLDEQLAREKPWTDKWVQLQQDKADAAHYWADATLHYLEALAAKQASIEDNMFKVGDLNADQYDLILHRRLASLEKYSDEWTRVYDEIKQLEGDTLDSELKIIEAVEKQRQFDMAFYGAQSQRDMYSALTPVSGMSAGATSTYGPTYNVAQTIQTANPYAAATTANEQLRNYAAMAG